MGRLCSRMLIIWFIAINPFHATGLFLYTMKTLENLWFSDVFRGYRKRQVASTWLTHSSPDYRMVSFCTPRKQKTKGYLMSSGEIEATGMK